MVEEGRCRVTSKLGQDVRVNDFLIPREFELACPGIKARPGLRMSFEVLDGAPQCRSVEITSEPGGRALISSDLREINVDIFTTNVAAMISTHVVEEREDGGTVAVATFSPQDIQNAMNQIERARARSGPRRKREVELQQVADVYASAASAPTKAVADHFDMPHRTAGLYVRRARDAGLLEEVAQKGSRTSA